MKEKELEDSKLTKVLMVIPSYHREELLHSALKSIKKNMIDKLEKYKSKGDGLFDLEVICYIQDASPDGRKLLEESFGNDNNVTLKFVKKYPKNTGLGRIIKDSVLTSPKAVADADYLFLCDDDVDVLDTLGDKLLVNLYRTFYKMSIDGTKVASGAISQSNTTGVLRYMEWPGVDKNIYCMYKEKFILVKAEEEVVKTIFSSEMDDYHIGDDMYIFLKALAAKFPVKKVTGFNDFIHIQHECPDHKKYKRFITGGFHESVYDNVDKVYDETKKHEQKYRDAIYKGKGCQSLLWDFFDYNAILDPMARNVRHDILDYAKNNLTIDENYNIKRVALKKVKEPTEFPGRYRRVKPWWDMYKELFNALNKRFKDKGEFYTPSQFNTMDEALERLAEIKDYK